MEADPDVQFKLDDMQQQIDQLRSMIPLMPYNDGGSGSNNGEGFMFIKGNDTNIVFTPYGRAVKVDVYYV